MPPIRRSIAAGVAPRNVVEVHPNAALIPGGRFFRLDGFSATSVVDAPADWTIAPAVEGGVTGFRVTGPTGASGSVVVISL